MPTTQTCRKCGAVAKHSVIGHLYEIKCSSCGFLEAGTFSPIHNFPPAAAVSVNLNLGDALPTAANLLGLSKLDFRFSKLSPIELRAAFMSGPLINLGSLNGQDIDALKRNAEAFGFTIQITNHGL